MKTFSFLLLVFFILQLSCGIEARGYFDDNSESTATTTIGVLNATFTWTIKNYNLMKWRLIHSPKAIIGPVLKTKNGKRVNCSVVPSVTNQKLYHFEISDINREWHFAIPKLNCDFNPEPTTVEYSYVGKENEKKYGVEIYSYNVEKDVEIIIHALYSDTEFPNKSYDDEDESFKI